MSAKLQEIKNWLDEANKNKATHLIITVDTFDYENYPVYVTSNKNIQKEIKRIESSSMQSIDEVYNMSLSIDKQLSEHRAYHI